MPDAPMRAVLVARDEDRFGERHGFGLGAAAFKVSTEDSRGALFAVELAYHAKGGPARHIHHEQDEWVYAIEGEYVFEVGDERYRLTPGDSLFLPRGVPHAWAFVGERPGRLVGVFAPAGQMEAFFRGLSKADAMAPYDDPGYWRAYGIELVGPPLAVE
jgi:quercetin dioxygenase-like cupin family protein